MYWSTVLYDQQECHLYTYNFKARDYRPYAFLVYEKYLFNKRHDSINYLYIWRPPLWLVKNYIHMFRKITNLIRLITEILV